MKAEIEYIKHKKYGRIVKLTFKNKSCIYAHDEAITFSIPYTKARMERCERGGVIQLTATREEMKLLLEAVDKIEGRDSE